MKPSLLRRLRARLAVSRHKKQQGVAILTVLAIITLMTVLVVSFFQMAQSAKVTAKGSVEIQRVTTLKDTIINLVIAQFREASRLSPTGANTSARDIITWTSQPGAIRTYSGNPSDFSFNRVFKLYSSDVPQIANIRPYETASLLDEINKDLAPDWAERPDEFTDINRPVYTAASGDRARATGKTDSTGYAYPIVDPRAYNGRNGTRDLERNIEGFTYSGTSRTLAIKGVDPIQEQLAMPVRWIYILQDGTLGYLDANKEFQTLNGSKSGNASRENPIVGRLAWWADDESCKVNVNTASVPAAWDTPRTTSLEDQWLAANQPIGGEFQRYPGHPATVDLSAVFYPNRRWVPDALVGILAPTGWSPAGGKMNLLKMEDAKRIWDLAPFIVGDDRELVSGTVGTGGGSKDTPRDSTVGASDSDRLFTSMDEVYFKASGATNKSLNAPRSNLLTENKDGDGEFLKTLERAQFFLTHKSHSPELTNQGFPRVSMFPMHTSAVAQVGNTGSGSLPAEVSPYDVTMALNSTIGGKSSASGGNSYFFQRQDPNSRHNEFWGYPRNVRVFTYLKELSKLPIAGYPEAVRIKSQIAAVVAEDPDGLSLTSKYPPGLSGAGVAYTSAYGTNSVMDSSDRTQILLNMLDYTRTINMQPAFLTGTNRYDDGFGKSAGVCGCSNVAGSDTNDTHNKVLLYSNQTTRSPKGTGKIHGAAEIAILVNIAAKREGGAGTPASTSWGQLAGQMSAASRARADSSDPGTRYIVEVGFIFSAFNPKHGWSFSFPQGGLAVTGVAPGNSSSVLSPDNSPLPIKTRDEEVLSTHGPTSGLNIGGRNDGDRVFAKGPGANQGILPLGGLAGPRGLMSTRAGTDRNIATIRPFCIISPDASPDPGLTCDPSIPIRVLVMDGVGEWDVTQITDLSLPADFFKGPKPSYTGERLSSLIAKYANGTLGFPDQRLLVRSFVLPHGDYRLTSTPSRVDADVFVPVEGYNGTGISHSFYEFNSNPSLRNVNPSQAPKWDPAIGLMDPLKVKRYVLSNGNDANVPRLTSLPFARPDRSKMGITEQGNVKFLPQDSKILDQASRNPARQQIFAHGRRDGRGIVPYRGSSDPSETGDFDTGVAASPDGPYMNYADEGDRRGNNSDSYFRKLLFLAPKPSGPGLVGGQNISPNFLVRSPVDFGSIPSGVANRVPWQTLRFRPDNGMNKATNKMGGLNDVPPPGMPFANFCGPRDHFFLDMFWMPVVEPWSISEPFSTKGTINLNQQIFPFMYIERTTALHALLRGERMTAIPNEAAEKYKNVNPTTGEPVASQDPSYRHFINAKETVRQFTKRYKEGADFDSDPPAGNPLAFNVFRSASEICEVWLVPENLTGSSGERTLETTIGNVTATGPQGFWTDHMLTGDNLRERPYANLYPRVTVRSNVFKLHLVAQTLQKALSEDPKKFNSIKDSVTAEWRGSCMIERSIDPRDPALTNIDYTNLKASNISQTQTPRLDRYYTYRVTEVKQMTQ